MILLLAVAVFALSAGFTWCLRRYALEKGVLDIPNDRSSHQVPTPRGGGLAIAAAFLFGVVALGFVYPFSANVAVALISGGALAALVGFWDDHRPLSPGSRLAIHFCAALVVLFAIGGFPRLSLFGVQAPDWLLGAFSLLFLVSILNLYNFMDGIDGIAGLEAVTVCAGGSAIGIVANYEAGAYLCLLLGAASAGFLVWNFPPARIFMGDVGSGFLGLVLGILALDFALQEPRLFWSWLILLGSFIVDASVTLVRRLLRRERVYLAHRTHAYQHAARRFGHRRVTVAFGFLNALWLLPIALLVATGHIRGEIGLAVAWMPLAALAVHWRAGLPELGGGARQKVL